MLTQFYSLKLIISIIIPRSIILFHLFFNIVSTSWCTFMETSTQDIASPHLHNFFCMLIGIRVHDVFVSCVNYSNYNALGKSEHHVDDYNQSISKVPIVCCTGTEYNITSTRKTRSGNFVKTN